jgi:hypothetical protein
MNFFTILFAITPAFSQQTDCPCQDAVLTFTYIGGDCSQTTQDQGGIASCSGNSIAGDVDFRIFFDEILVREVLGFSIGQSFFGHGPAPNVLTTFVLVDSNDSEQTLVLDTCCSLLEPGNIFGALQFVGSVCPVDPLPMPEIWIKPSTPFMSGMKSSGMKSSGMKSSGMKSSGMNQCMGMGSMGGMSKGKGMSKGND